MFFCCNPCFRSVRNCWCDNSVEEVQSVPLGVGFLFSFTPARRRWTSSALTHDEKEQISMEDVTESVRMHEYVEPETTPVASRVFDEMVRVRGVSQNMEPILQFLNQNVEIVDLVLLERISAGFYTHPIHVPISNTSDTTPFDWTCCARTFCRRFCDFSRRDE